MKKLISWLALPAGAAMAGAAFAQSAPKPDSGDTAWMLMSTVLVVIMVIPGLALFYGGMVRAKNTLSVLMQVLVTLSLMSVLWALLGYSLAFSEGTGFIGGLSKAFLSGVTPDKLQGTIPEVLFAVFQLTFAAITPALIVGAFAERMKFSAVLWFLTLWLFACYAPLAQTGSARSSAVRWPSTSRRPRPGARRGCGMPAAWPVVCWPRSPPTDR